MNKTTEAFEAWWADTGEQSLYALNTTTDDDIKTIAGIAWEAAIREALAEPRITTPDVCGEVCARAKLCYGCNKAFDEVLADHVEQSLTMVADHSGDANEMVAEPVQHNERYWLHEINNARADGYERGYMAAKKLYSEPVKQGPVGDMASAWFKKCCQLQDELNTVKQAPVDAKAIREALANARAEALEEAAKWFEGYDNQAWFELTQEEAAAAIRGLK